MKQYTTIEDYFPLVEHRLSLNDRHWLVKTGDFINHHTFSDISVSGLEDVIATKNQGRHLVYYPRHLSEFDWIILQLTLTHAHLPSTIQAGENLFIGPFDSWLRQAGGFKVFRKPKKVYDEHWIINECKEFLDKLHLPVSNIEITKKLAGDLYLAYLPTLLDKGEDVIIFGETKTEGDEHVYGRSQTGNLLSLSPNVFKVAMNYDHYSLVPVSFSYERVVEDSHFRSLRILKDSEHWIFRKMVYPIDFFHNVTQMAREKPGRVHLSFGKPLPIADLKHQGYTWRRKTPDYLREKIGELSTFYPTQITALALYLAKGKNILSPNEISMQQLKTAISHLQENLPPQSRIHLPNTIDETIEQAHTQFWQWPTRCIARFDRKNAVVYDPSVLQQYAMHNIHLLENLT